ncbi:MAG: S8 family serine peptidase [Microcoleus sp. SU_5_3]|nr:S8 family serine peptidase [Microcoleus sp. SU_5_3]
MSTTNPPETKTETTPAIEAKNPTVSETPNPVTTPVETKTDSPAIETKNSTVSEIPNPVTIPSETKTETSLTTATQNPTVSSISNFPINPVATEIDLITGNTLETPVFLQPNEPETPTIIPAAATDILTGEIENNSPTFTDSLETTSENAENFPPLSDEEIARFWENLNRIWAEADENSENSEPSESEYLIPNTDSDAENPTYTPDIGVTENYQPTNTENTTSFDSIEGEEWDADTTESATTAIISETTTPANDPPETSGTPIPDSASNYETNSNESAVADTDSELETTSDSSQATKPLIGIIDTGFAANNPNIDYNNIVLGKDLIDNDSNPLIQPNENNQHGTTILEIIAGDNNKNETPIWLGRATGSGNWHQSLIEFTNAVKAAKQPNAVVNLSFDLTQINPDGTQTTRHKLTAEERLALQYAKDNNILIVAAAGNEGNLLSALGQASNEFDNIITVGAAENNYRAGYSSYGEGLDILAAGDIPQTTETATTETKQGTSIAAAKVTNTISQMWAANPSLDYQQIKNILLNTAKDIDVPDWDERTGYGILNSELAIATAAEAIPTIPVLAAAKLLTKPLINATENIGNSPNSTPEKPSERATATTSTAPGTPKITSTSTGDYNVGTNSYTRDVAPYKTTTTSSSNGTTTTNSRILSSLANTESNWDRSTTKTNHKAESFDESTSDSTTNASTYTSKTFSQNSTENKNQWQENRSRVKHEGTRSDSSESAQKSRGSYNYTTPTYTRNDASESYRNSKSQSNSQFGTNLSIFNGDRQDDWGSKSTTNTRTNNGNNVSTANSATQTAGNAKWTNGSSGNTSNSTHSGEETTVNTSNSTNSNSSGFSKSSSSNDNYSVVNSTWDNTTNGGVAVNTNTRDFYSESNSNSQSSYDDGKTKNTSDRDSYNVSKSEQTNSSQGSTYRQNNRHNNYSESRGNDTQTYKDGPYNNRRTTDSYSITRSDGYSANSSGKITSQNNSETFSGNYIQDENEYKVDAYTTTSRGDDETITSTRSSSSNDGTNNTSSSSSDTVRTRNGQTVTVYKNGLKNENENSSYQRWWSETATDRGQSATTNGYESWSSSYTRSEFKGGYSWSETISGTNTTSVTKGGTTTSKQSNWSWTRSGTVWDDGRNSWNESWSKSNWENGKSIPGESETARGSYDPKGTGTQTNNLPEAGDAPRLTKPPKNVVELNKQPKYKPQPSQELWTTPLPTPPRVIENPPDNQFAGSGAPPKGNLPQNKINALKDVIQRLLSFFRPLGEFVAGAVYQWLRNNGDLGRWLLQVFIPGWNGLDQDVERNLPKTWAFQTGRTFGDGAAIVTGILEMIAGGGAAAGGSSLCITGFGCIGGAPALVAGTALALHGSTTASRGLSNILAGIAENLGVVFRVHQVAMEGIELMNHLHVAFQPMKAVQG